MLKRLKFTVLLSCFTLIANAQTFSGGSGTHEDPYKIGTVEDLIGLSIMDKTEATVYWTKHYELISDIDFGADKTLVDWNGDGIVDWDSDDNLGFCPIGDSEDPVWTARIGVTFSGAFNGKGHVISNLYINRSEGHVGLFGFCEGQIDSIGLENVWISGGFRSGGIAGKLDGYNLVSPSVASVTNSYVSGGKITGYGYVGGLVGDTHLRVLLENCYANVIVEETAHTNGNAGGLVGWWNINSTITNCYASGKVMHGNKIGGLYVSPGDDVKTSFWDIETSTLDSSSGGTGLTSYQFTIQSTFENAGWDFNNTWQMGAISQDPYIRPRLQWQNIDNDVVLIPIGISADNITENSLTLAWTEIGTSTKWQVEYGYTNFEPGNGNLITTSSSSVDISNLDYGRYYDFYVRAIKGDDTSEWSALKTIVTPIILKEGGDGSEIEPYRISTMEDLHKVSKAIELWDKNYILTADIDAFGTKTSETFNNEGKGFSPIGSQTNPFTGAFNGKGYRIINLYCNRSDLSNIGFFGTISGKSTIDSVGIVNAHIIGNKIVAPLVAMVEDDFIAGTTPEIRHCYASGGIIEGKSVVGGLVGLIYGAIIENSYSAVEIISNESAGGFVGSINSSLSSIKNCYSATSIIFSDDSVNIGGFVGQPFSYAAVTNSYWDIMSSGLPTSGMGEGLRTEDFANSSSFENWDFTNTWKISKSAGDTTLRPRLFWQQTENLYDVYIKVVTTTNEPLKNVEVKVANYPSYTTDNNGIIETVLESGDYAYLSRLDYYASDSGTITVAQNETFSIIMRTTAFDYPDFTITTSSPSCNSFIDGSITISSLFASIDIELNGSSYTIENGNPVKIENLSAGTYELLAKMGLEERLFQATIPEIAAVKSTAIVQNNSVTFSIKGGQVPYEISINDDVYFTDNSVFTIDNLKSGNYTAFVRDKNNCADEVAINFAIEGFKLYPNPSMGLINIYLPAPGGNEYQVKIFSANGQTVFNKIVFIEDNRFGLDVSHLDKGNYIFYIYNNDYNNSVNFIIR